MSSLIVFSEAGLPRCGLALAPVLARQIGRSVAMHRAFRSTVSSCSRLPSSPAAKDLRRCNAAANAQGRIAPQRVPCTGRHHQAPLYSISHTLHCRLFSNSTRVAEADSAETGGRGPGNGDGATASAQTSVDDVDYDLDLEDGGDDDDQAAAKTKRKQMYIRQKGRSFIDYVRVRLQAGAGGNGCASFRREANLPRGGPDGGNGGHGGALVLRASAAVTDFSKVSKSYRARRGEHGRGRQQHGKAAEDVVIPVPVGTIVRGEDGEIVADLSDDGQQVVAAVGGAGGRGNMQFRSGSNRAPRQFTFGGDGQLRMVELELKTIADVGLVGFPNAGKSSFLSAVSNAHPKIAPYPFTTLNPYVGSVEFDDYYRMTVADIPGLVKGAHLNIGLGHSFLRHIERSRVLVYIVDAAGCDGRDPVQDLEDLRHEIRCYHESMPLKPSVVVANKTDLPAAEENVRRLREASGLPVLSISAMHGMGIRDATRQIRSLVESALAAAAAAKQGRATATASSSAAITGL